MRLSHNSRNAHNNSKGYNRYVLMFAKPFVAALEGHVDAVETMARKPDTLDIVASGSWDGGAHQLLD